MMNIIQFLVNASRQPKTCHSPPAALLEDADHRPLSWGLEHSTREKG